MNLQSITTRYYVYQHCAWALTWLHWSVTNLKSTKLLFNLNHFALCLGFFDLLRHNIFNSKSKMEYTARNCIRWNFCGIRFFIGELGARWETIFWAPVAKDTIFFVGIELYVGTVTSFVMKAVIFLRKICASIIVDGRREQARELAFSVSKQRLHRRYCLLFVWY